MVDTIEHKEPLKQKYEETLFVNNSQQFSTNWFFLK